jgi:hypothetical protein
MKTLRVALALLALGIVGSLIFSASTHAASTNPNPIVNIGNVPLPVNDVNTGKYTHVGQKPSNVVNLITVGGGLTARVDPATGYSVGEIFKVPDGSVLVLTDTQGYSACTAGTNELVELDNGSAQGFVRSILTLVCPSTGVASFDRHYNTGLLFGAGSEVSLTLDGGSNVFMYAQGYLVPAN